mmetsp:Transcript_83421/g.268910  ORF Transcript_83421/g.268910 Transcript_83421/m.268910 type:complete len:240 (-) Transcript_83421:3941-4660(-)
MRALHQLHCSVEPEPLARKYDLSIYIFKVFLTNALGVCLLLRLSSLAVLGGICRRSGNLRPTQRRQGHTRLAHALHNLAGLGQQNAFRAAVERRLEDDRNGLEGLPCDIREHVGRARDLCDRAALLGEERVKRKPEAIVCDDRHILRVELSGLHQCSETRDVVEETGGAQDQHQTDSVRHLTVCREEHRHLLRHVRQQRPEHVDQHQGARVSLHRRAVGQHRCGPDGDAQSCIRTGGHR